MGELAPRRDLHSRRRNTSTQIPAGDRDYFGAVVAPLALILLAYPVIDVFAPGLSGPILVGTSALLAPFVLSKIKDLPWPAVWLLLLSVAYGLSALFGPRRSQGMTHTTTLVCVTIVFLCFALYGYQLMQQSWFRYSAAILVTISLLVVFGASLPKNAKASSLFYVAAILVVLILHRKKISGASATISYSVAGALISLNLGVRSLLVYSLLFLVAYICANRLSPRIYRIVGVTICGATIVAISWFFLNIYGSPLAAEVSHRITEMSGERADSGRQFLWPYILHAVGENQLFGLGAGTLPRDVVSTRLSAHNYYLQVYLQLGLAGLAIVVAFLLSTWNVMVKATSSVGKFGSALFLVFVIHNGTEVLMFQNQTLISVPAWTAIGLAFAADRGSHTETARAVGLEERVTLHNQRASHTTTLKATRASTARRRR